MSLLESKTVFSYKVLIIKEYICIKSNPVRFNAKLGVQVIEIDAYGRYLRNRSTD